MGKGNSMVASRYAMQDLGCDEQQVVCVPKPAIRYHKADEFTPSRCTRPTQRLGAGFHHLRREAIDLGERLRCRRMFTDHMCLAAR